jgi:hypothetical protein
MFKSIIEFLSGFLIGLPIAALISSYDIIKELLK